MSEHALRRRSSMDQSSPLLQGRLQVRILPTVLMPGGGWYRHLCRDHAWYTFHTAVAQRMQSSGLLPRGAQVRILPAVFMKRCRTNGKYTGL